MPRLRVPTATLVGLLLLAAAMPLSAALPTGVPAFSAGDSDRIGGFTWFGAGAAYCSSWINTLVGDLGAIPTNSEIRHTSTGATTSYHLHVESPAGSTCPTVDFTFVSTLYAWPDGHAYASVSSACGTTGQIEVFQGDPISLRLDVNIPAGCGAGVAGYYTLIASVQALHPRPYLVCAPASLTQSSCLGAWERGGQDQGCGDDPAYGVTVAPLVLVASNQCAHSGQGAGTYFGVLGAVFINKDDRGCTLGALLVGDVATCPAELGDAVGGVHWGHLLP